jgi:hypothetical protein
MFYCSFHNWYSSITSCPVCYPTSITYASTDEFIKQKKVTAMSKRSYRLLKPLPDANVGTFFVNDGNGNYDYTSKDGIASFYHQHQVEENPEWFSEIILPESKEWEVVALSDNHTKYLYETYDRVYWGNKDWYSHHLKQGRHIHSVKRLSDGIVFSVGDEVAWGKKWDNMSDTTQIEKIAGFVIQQHDVFPERGKYLGFTTLKYPRGIDFIGAVELRKLPPSNKPESKENKEDAFKWTDLLATEWAGYLEQKLKYSSIQHIPQLLIEWKELKQSKHPIPEPEPKERIEVIGFWFECHSKWNYEYGFEVSGMIPEEKKPLIKQAIEKVLNDNKEEINYNESYVNNLKRKIDALEVIHKAYQYLISKGYYTQQQMDEAREDAFNAARSGYKVQIPHDPYKYGDIKYHYPTLNDYLNSLKSDKK